MTQDSVIQKRAKSVDGELKKGGIFHTGMAKIDQIW